jgi:hypothetical protein
MSLHKHIPIARSLLRTNFRIQMQLVGPGLTSEVVLLSDYEGQNTLET